MKEPKRYECTNPECGFISNRTKSLRFTGITFAICFKCKGRLRENKAWLAWMDEQRDRVRKVAIERNGGMLLGVKIV